MEPPLIATAFSGCLNGYTIRSARRESAIVIDEQLIHIANLQGTLLSECFTLREAGRPVADFDIGRLSALTRPDSPFAAKWVQPLIFGHSRRSRRRGGGARRVRRRRNARHNTRRLHLFRDRA